MVTFGFMGLELGKRALQAQNRSMEVTGHNIANANTEGYSRQRAEQVTSYPYTKPSLNVPSGAGQIGTGVKVASIQRIRDEFVDARIRSESRTLGYGEKLRDGLYELELIFNEPTEYGIRESLDEFWISLQELVNNPESMVVRYNVKERGLALTQSMNYVAEQLLEFRKDLDVQLGYKVTEINGMAEGIADLNFQIAQVEGTGKKANDLEDKRDLMLKNLSRLADIRAVKDDRGQVNLSLGGRRLVQGDYYQQIHTSKTGEGGRLELTWADTGAPVVVKSGEVKGILDIRDETVPFHQDRLDDLALNLVSFFNQQHYLGVDLDGKKGEDFFVYRSGLETDRDIMMMVRETMNEFYGILTAEETEALNLRFGLEDGLFRTIEEIALELDVSEDNINEILTRALQRMRLTKIGSVLDEPARYIDVNINIIDDPRKIAAADNKEGLPGNNKNAIELTNIFTKRLMDKESFTFNEYYTSLVSNLGVQRHGAENLLENQEHLLHQLENWQESIAGVSLDEEMANLIRFQHAYNAAARLINVTDQILETLIGLIR